ncbi:hypothetical protein [Olivibacter jilunii]|nr:hypothetical protein [Olivibacter jilunii]QEK99695.1 hypothetical protein FKG96_02405 [Olivibacter sp. LS-1]
MMRQDTFGELSLRRFRFHIAKGVYINLISLYLDAKRGKHQGFVSYLAPDGKAPLARIGAVSLPQSTWYCDMNRRVNALLLVASVSSKAILPTRRAILRAEDNNTSG